MVRVSANAVDAVKKLSLSCEHQYIHKDYAKMPDGALEVKSKSRKRYYVTTNNSRMEKL